MTLKLFCGLWFFDYFLITLFLFVVFLLHFVVLIFLKKCLCGSWLLFNLFLLFDHIFASGVHCCSKMHQFFKNVIALHFTFNNLYMALQICVPSPRI
jgi:hypothetical protein